MSWFRILLNILHAVLYVTPSSRSQVLGGDPASSAGDEVHGVEPQEQGRGGLLEDRSLQRMGAMPARLAVPGRALVLRRVTLEGALRLAAWAKGVVAVRGEALAPDVLEASFVVGELAHELQQVARRFRGRGASRIEAVNRGHCAAPCGLERVGGCCLRRVRFSFIHADCRRWIGRHPTRLGPFPLRNRLPLVEIHPDELPLETELLARPGSRVRETPTSRCGATRPEPSGPRNKPASYRGPALKGKHGVRRLRHAAPVSERGSAYGPVVTTRIVPPSVTVNTYGGIVSALTPLLLLPHAARREPLRPAMHNITARRARRMSNSREFSAGPKVPCLISARLSSEGILA